MDTIFVLPSIAHASQLALAAVFAGVVCTNGALVVVVTHWPAICADVMLTLRASAIWPSTNAVPVVMFSPPGASVTVVAHCGGGGLGGGGGLVCAAAGAAANSSAAAT